MKLLAITTVSEDTDPRLPDTDVQTGTSGLAKFLNDLDDQYRAGKNSNVPLDLEQRLELALRDSKRAVEIAEVTGRVLNNLSDHVQRGFADINDKLERLANGQPLEDVEDDASVFD